MNKRGFTLIELIAAITVMLILMTLVVINVKQYIDKAELASYEALVQSIKTSTELYVSEHSTEFPELNIPGSTFTIELNALVNDGYVKSKVVDERTGQPIPLDTPIQITVTSKNKINVDFSVN